jgi:hypothetical protein
MYSEKQKKFFHKKPAKGGALIHHREVLPHLDAEHWLYRVRSPCSNIEISEAEKLPDVMRMLCLPAGSWKLVPFCIFPSMKTFI